MVSKYGLKKKKTFFAHFLQDNCPVQNSKKALDAFKQIECSLFGIPPRSPDMNPIENLFSLVRRNLNREAISKQITCESFDEFSNRVRACFNNVNTRIINNMIKSMPKRLRMVKENRRCRINY